LNGGVGELLHCNSLRMKNFFLIGYFLLVGLTSQAQSKEWLSKSWQIDVEAMRAVLQTRLTEEPNYANLAEGERLLALQTALQKIEGIKVVYQTDGSYTSETSKGLKKGTWKADFESQKVTVVLEDKTQIFDILQLTAHQLVLRTDKGMLLYFKPLS
jgi:hypothetical protein